MCSFLSAVFGICRGLSTNYKMFAAFEFLDAFFGSGIYGTAFILGRWNIILIFSRCNEYVYLLQYRSFFKVGKTNKLRHLYLSKGLKMDLKIWVIKLPASYMVPQEFCDKNVQNSSKGQVLALMCLYCSKEFT